jgi:hypothetical protein
MGTVTDVPIWHGLALTNAGGLPFGFYFRQLEVGRDPTIIELEINPVIGILPRRQHRSLDNFVHCDWHRNTCPASPLHQFSAISGVPNKWGR